MPPRIRFPIAGARALFSHLRALVADDLPAMFGDMTARINGELARAGLGNGGVIAPAAEDAIRRAAGDIVVSYFTAPAAFSPYPDRRAPYAADNTALARYPQILNQRIAAVTAAVALGHWRYLRRRLPPDLFAWLQRPIVAEQVFAPRARPNPLAVYQSAHTWVDPNGYRLSDRIWRTSQSTRDRVDRLLSDGIRNGRSVEDMAKDLERFLQPGRQLRTRMPYGRDASFDAMRLARTEVTRAHAEAARVTAHANPFVGGWDWALSARHPRIDICDDLATIGMDGARLRDPYPLDGSEPIPTESSHPMCICVGFSAVAADPAAALEDLYAMRERNEPAPLTPAALIVFLQSLLGAALMPRARESLQAEGIAA